jgi:hypothetical protein
MAEEHHVMWWIPDGVLPTLPEAMERLESLHRKGSSPDAFTFRDPYPDPDPAGDPRITQPTG